MIHLLYKYPVTSIIIATPIMSIYAAYKEDQVNAERFINANVKKMSQFNRCMTKYYANPQKCSGLK
jgi:hypothetical protein